MSTRDDDDYEVGYAKPPKATRFRKGQSGNPGGRPKGARGFAASIKRELESKVTVREGSNAVQISKAQAMAKRLSEKALKGDMQALKILLQIDQDLAAEAVANAEATESRVSLDQTDDNVLAYFVASLKDTEPKHEAEAADSKSVAEALSIRHRRAPDDVS